MTIEDQNGVDRVDRKAQWPHFLNKETRFCFVAQRVTNMRWGRRCWDCPDRTRICQRGGSRGIHVAGAAATRGGHRPARAAALPLWVAAVTPLSDRLPSLAARPLRRPVPPSAPRAARRGAPLPAVRPTARGPPSAPPPSPAHARSARLWGDFPSRAVAGVRPACMVADPPRPRPIVAAPWPRRIGVPPPSGGASGAGLRHDTTTAAVAAAAAARPRTTR